MSQLRTCLTGIFSLYWCYGQNLSYYLPASLQYKERNSKPASVLGLEIGKSGRAQKYSSCGGEPPGFRKVISFADNLNFPAFWWGTNKLYINVWFRAY